MHGWHPISDRHPDKSAYVWIAVLLRAVWPVSAFLWGEDHLGIIKDIEELARDKMTTTVIVTIWRDLSLQTCRQINACVHLLLTMSSSKNQCGTNNAEIHREHSDLQSHWKSIRKHENGGMRMLKVLLGSGSAEDENEKPCGSFVLYKHLQNY